MTNQWVALSRFLEDGRLEIDNNATESDLRPIAAGRKAWVFAGSNEAAARSADVYTVIMSAKRCKLEPHAYLRYVLAEIPRLPRHEGPEREAFLDSLLPDRWKAPETEDERFLAHLGPDILTAFLQSLTISRPAPKRRS